MTAFWTVVILGVLLLLWLNRHHIFRRRPLVVLVHGWLSSCEAEHIRKMLQKLQRAGFKVECYSLSFHHKTFWPNPDGSAKSLARFLEEKGLKEYKLALVGHSLGGIVIKAFAVKNWEEAWGFEVAGIVTVDSPHNGVTKSLGKILGNALIGPHSSVMEAGKTQRYILSVLQRL